MKKSKFTEEQIAFALKQAESGTSVEEIRRKMGSAWPRSTPDARSSAGWGGRATPTAPA